MLASVGVVRCVWVGDHAILRRRTPRFSNLDTCITMMADIRFAVKPFVLSPLMFGDPQSRDRLYMPSIRERLLQALQVDGDEFFDKVSEILRIFIGFPITPLNSVLLSDQDSYIRTLIWSWIGQNPTDFRFECVQVRNMINETEPKDLPKWLQMVLTGCQKLHVSIDKFLQPPSQDFMTMFPYVRTLTLRGWIILQMNAPSLPAMGMPSVIDLSQNFELQDPKVTLNDNDNDNDSQPRAVGGGGVCGCFTPSGIKVHTGKVRPICGLEGFRLQNIYFLGDDADEKLREFSDDLLHDLAGNAMHCGCSTAMTLAVFTAIAPSPGFLFSARSVSHGPSLMPLPLMPSPSTGGGLFQTPISRLRWRLHPLLRHWAVEVVEAALTALIVPRSPALLDF